MCVCLSLCSAEVGFISCAQNSCLPVQSTHFQASKRHKHRM